MAAILAEKLLITPQSRVLLLNAPIGYAKKLEPLPEGVTITDRRSQTADLNRDNLHTAPESDELTPKDEVDRHGD